MAHTKKNLMIVGLSLLENRVVMKIWDAFEIEFGVFGFAFDKLWLILWLMSFSVICSEYMFSCFRLATEHQKDE